MKKIPTIFVRDFTAHKSPITRAWHPDALWVRDGEGWATLKYDGTCCMVRGGVLYKRYDAKKGQMIPMGFISAMAPDPITGHHAGWLVVDGYDPADQWHREAWEYHGCATDGTYELCGPKVQGNPEKQSGHRLLKHGDQVLPSAPRDYDGLAIYFKDRVIEGIVWHHKGRMAKIKRRDFGLPWPA